MIHRFLWLYLLLTLCPAHAARLAWVIGNEHYAHAADLHNPLADAQDMRQVLHGLGFNVTHLTDANKRSMDTALRQFIARLKQSGGEAVVYFSGHGLQHLGGNYLVPMDANPQTGADIPYETVSAQRILDNLREVNSTGVNLLILDACRHNPFKSLAKSSARGLTHMQANDPGKLSSSLVLYATAPGTVALGNSIFLFEGKKLKKLSTQKTYRAYTFIV